jgi:hypothetical protein
MFGRMQERLTYANVVATIALFVALGGGAYAAVKLPANSVGAKQLKRAAVTGKKIASGAITSAKVKDGSLLKVDFAAGQLPRGPAGAQGPRGDTGAKGDPGQLGPAGPFLDTLPAGKSVRGVFNFGADVTQANDLVFGDISFVFPFATTPNVIVVPVGGPTPAGCSGTATNSPGAASGNVCLFQTDATNGSLSIIPGSFADHRYGLGMYAFAAGTGTVHIVGNWVATGD